MFVVWAKKFGHNGTVCTNYTLRTSNYKYYLIFSFICYMEVGTLAFPIQVKRRQNDTHKYSMHTFSTNTRVSA